MNKIAEFCINCGAPLEANIHFCGKCGAKVEDQKNSSSEKMDYPKPSKSFPWKYVLFGIFILTLIGVIVSFLYMDDSRNNYRTIPSSLSNQERINVSADPQQHTEKARKIMDDIERNKNNYSSSKNDALWDEVIQHIQKAVSLDDAEGYYLLAMLHEDGYRHIKRDLGEMIHNLAISAQKGYAEAQFTLGYMYANGDEVDKDKTKGLDLLNKAANQGHQEAKKELENILSKETQTSSEDGVNALYKYLD